MSTVLTDYATTIGNATGEVRLLYQHSTTGTMCSNVYLSQDHTGEGGGLEFERSLSKSPIIVPIPNDDSVGFDINLVDADTIRISVTYMDGIGPYSTSAILIDLFKKKALITDTSLRGKPYGLLIGENVPIIVYFKSLSVSLSSGQGDIVSVNMMFDVGKEQ